MRERRRNSGGLRTTRRSRKVSRTCSDVQRERSAPNDRTSERPNVSKDPNDPNDPNDLWDDARRGGRPRMFQLIPRSIRLVLSSVIALITVTVAAAQSLPAGRLLVLLRNASALAIVDPASGNVLGRVPVGRDPHEVAVTPDG